MSNGSVKEVIYFLQKNNVALEKFTFTFWGKVLLVGDIVFVAILKDMFRFAAGRRRFLLFAILFIPIMIFVIKNREKGGFFSKFLLGDALAIAIFITGVILIPTGFLLKHFIG